MLNQVEIAKFIHSSLRWADEGHVNCIHMLAYQISRMIHKLTHGADLSVKEVVAELDLFGADVTTRTPLDWSKRLDPLINGHGMTAEGLARMVQRAS